MDTQQEIDYNRIASAIDYFKANFKSQPSLEDVAAYVHLSNFHFQRMFKDWAGVTPKQFLQYLSINYAKGILNETAASIADAAFETGLSGTGRLHDLFIKIEGMTPGEYRHGGESLHINYSFADSPFGLIMVAATPKGICHMAFVDKGTDKALAELKAIYPNAQYQQIVDSIQQNALFVFSQDWKQLDTIKLHLKGTQFQIKVWETLLKIPAGGLTTYASLATQTGNPQAARAVGSAVASNPIAFLIPCHRVIRSTGVIGEYHWSTNRKNAIIGWEAARKHLNEHPDSES
ncbi:methylated-DNA--[protein]-cysteine S-methyltransferase [Chitinophaga silvatica]|uniref:methylated-DNA--[protein]-cysteine S-methyltransferase n=1 Tax=Chitinophaga silvatica TaxID=2282649 RepID=A0A3E1Y483_9BACT|nr:methylated-DNA--[protein]-cysteine S-methyltransferase [Chitinophaga silvatica]RFS19297.1 methylated-DNA--[protein]-cysteine S-methyltransferase [Chitinophaga silvatica]